MKKFLKILGYGLLVILLIVVALLGYVNFGLPHVAAGNLHIALTPARIARGKYLANHVVGCLVCHSKRDTRFFGMPIQHGTEGEGGQVFGPEDGFPGTFVAQNITPYHLGNWTDGELLRAIACGENKDGQALFPIMPYTHFGLMDTGDIYSVIAYIRTLTPIDQDNPASKADFPMSLILHTIPGNPDFHPRPLPSDSVAYGQYMVNAALCALCHTQIVNGKPAVGMDFAGGMEFHMPTGGVLTSANITPDLETGIGGWTREAFIQRFKSTLVNNQDPAPAPKDAYNPVMPWQYYAGMTDQDLGAIYAYLRTLHPIHHTVVKFKP
ncbi:MAG TPA: cytochrome c [Chitinophagaceae bacterium]|nr:cytochrome c [Chitinophagaceae bacterium]